MQVVVQWVGHGRDGRLPIVYRWSGVVRWIGEKILWMATECVGKVGKKKGLKMTEDKS